MVQRGSGMCFQYESRVGAVGRGSWRVDGVSYILYTFCYLDGHAQ